MRLRSLSGLALAAAVLATGCNPEDKDLEHGFIKIDPRPRDGENATVFNNTTRIRLTMEYEMCVRDFYAREPDYAQTGIKGHPVFADSEADGEGWLDRLCDPKDAEQMDCEVRGIAQSLDGNTLQVEYNINDGVIEPFFLKFGPIPLDELTGCTSLMTLSNNAAQGFAGDTPIWRTSSWNNRQGRPNQGAPLVVRVERF